MNYRKFNEKRETLEKHLKEAIQAYMWVYETATEEADLSKEDIEKFDQIYDDMLSLQKKLKATS